jgi:hypothetical protein
MAFFVARRLARLGLDPLVVDAHEVRTKALRPNQKSDRRDALELCEGLRRGSYRSVVHVPPEPIERLRETLGRRRHFVRLKTMQVNAAKRLLRTAASGLSQAAAWPRLRPGTSCWPRWRSIRPCTPFAWRIARCGAVLTSRSLPWKARCENSSHRSSETSTGFRPCRAWVPSWR